jgi:ribonuclease Z
MARLIFLGTASALPSVEQDNTSLLLENNGSYFMIDSSGSPYRKLLKLGVDTDRLQHILITHEHIDHVYGLPSLVECLWIARRTQPLHIYALPSTMRVVETLLDLWELRNRMVNKFPIHLHTIRGKLDEYVFETPDFLVRTTPTIHAVPSVATKVIFPNGVSFVYSSDTGPCDDLIDFARGVDHFVAECTFCDADDELAEITFHLHSSEYRDMARAVGAKHTILIHHSDTGVCPHASVMDEIRQDVTFSQRVSIPHDLEIYDLDEYAQQQPALVGRGRRKTG